MRDAERLEKRRHHRLLVRKVIGDEQPRRHELGHAAEGHKMLRLLFHGKRDDALRGNLIRCAIAMIASACSTEAFPSLQNAFGRLQLALRRELFPQL